VAISFIRPGGLWLFCLRSWSFSFFPFCAELSSTLQQRMSGWSGVESATKTLACAKTTPDALAQTHPPSSGSSYCTCCFTLSGGLRTWDADQTQSDSPLTDSKTRGSSAKETVYCQLQTTIRTDAGSWRDPSRKLPHVEVVVGTQGNDASLVGINYVILC
jgi:hypothetical protein